jgi:hypothetical protein
MKGNKTRFKIDLQSDQSDFQTLLITMICDSTVLSLVMIKGYGKLKKHHPMTKRATILKHPEKEM